MGSEEKFHLLVIETRPLVENKVKEEWLVETSKRRPSPPQTSVGDSPRQIR
jgi:hypothetical protein